MERDRQKGIRERDREKKQIERCMLQFCRGIGFSFNTKPGLPKLFNKMQTTMLSGGNLQQNNRNSSLELLLT